MSSSACIAMGMPLAEADVRALHVGDFVLLSGPVFTGRDAVHRFLAHGGEAPCDLRGGVVYHCGPVALPSGGTWRIVAAGPTTSAREEPYMSDIIARYALRGVIGKGGMGEHTLAACQRHGCVYFHAVGGAAQVLATCISRVGAVHFRERFGDPEAIWELTLDRFPVLVTMDAHGESLHAAVAADSRRRLDALLARPAPTCLDSCAN